MKFRRPVIIHFKENVIAKLINILVQERKLVHYQKRNIKLRRKYLFRF